MLPALFNFRGCDLTARIPPRHGGCPGATPGDRTNIFSTGRAPASVTESPKLSLPGAAPGRPASFHGVVADKQCTCLASKPMWERYPPTPPISMRETRPMHRGKPHKLLQVGVTPTPATNFREVIRSPGCKPGVTKSAGSDGWSVTSTSHHFWIRSSISRAPRCLREG